MYCRQHSRADWLHYGDQNTKYFHNKANSRRKNAVVRIQNERGVWKEDEEEIVMVLEEYFCSIFQSEFLSEKVLNAATMFIDANCHKRI